MVAFLLDFFAKERNKFLIKFSDYFLGEYFVWE